ncbi:MAG: DUF58 domain-containing protein [Candidatus Cloacimonadota bacterium]|nr:MAG: DUF58 domain-containing protein [Candidatus Cloacimonadota bacterium]
MSEVSKELLKKVKRIQIQTSRLVNDVLAGEYHSTFKGRGMEFSEVREYVPGDDIRTIDWNVTARMDVPFVKQYVEERELTVILMVDISGSGYYSSKEQTKNEIAAEISAMFALSAIKNNDNVGLLLFTGKVEKFIPPKKGKSHVLRVIREVLSFQADQEDTNLENAIDYLNKAVRKKAVIFLISDFISKGYEKVLRVAAKRHDLICISLSDQREREMPDIGLVHLEDAETGEVLLFDTSDKKARKALQILFDRDKTQRVDFMKSNKIDTIDINTHQSYVDPIVGFFRNRGKWKK